MKTKRILSLFAAMILVFQSLPSAALETDYGLSVTTYPHPQSEFTSLSLEEGRPIRTGGGLFTMEFDLLNRQDNAFGTIFRIITDKGDNIDLMYTVSRDMVHMPMIVTGENVTLIPADIIFDQWGHVSISLDVTTGEISLDYFGAVTRIKDAGTKGARTFRIAFGYCPFQGYSLDDVASVDLRDIKILRSDRLVRHWALSLHDGDVCFDLVSKQRAEVSNPHWTIDKYVTWEPVGQMLFEKEPSVAFDGDQTFALTVDGSEITRFHVPTGSVETIPSLGGDYPSNAPWQLKCVSGGERLMAFNLDENVYAFFDFDSRMWSGGVPPTKEHARWNHSTVWDDKCETLYSFGGYGFFHYNNDLLVGKPNNPSASRSITMDALTPRYSATSCIADSLLFIFGGRGNLSSKQELSPHAYFELYAVDTCTFETTQIWRMDPPEEYAGVTMGENMIYDREKDCFYLLARRGNFELLKVLRTEPGIEQMSLPVYDEEHAQQFYTNLWLSGDSKHLYCVNILSQIDGKSDLRIYRMNYPPIPVSTLVQKKDAVETADSRWQLLKTIAAIVAVLLAGIGGYFFNKHRVDKAKKEADDARKAAFAAAQSGAGGRYYDFSKSSVCFLGGFKVTDADGKDITSQFTPMLKSLFVLLILYSAKNSDGIISNKLNKIMWSYKSEDSANNNRNVYMSKLRTILEKVGGVSIVNQNKFWSVKFDDISRCDYAEALRLCTSQASEENIDRLLELLLHGVMLPNMETEWVDSFKSSFSNYTIDFLQKQLWRTDIPDPIRIKAADIIFQHDFLNEEALKAKCSILYNEGKAGLAKSAYDSFCKEYEASIGMEYPVKFREMIG